MHNPASFHAWLFGIAKNKKVDFVRARRWKNNAIEKFEDLKDHEPTALESMLRDEERTKLLRSLERLPQIMLACMTLKLEEDLKNSAIAERLNITVAYVKILMFRARNILKDLLDDDWEDDDWEEAE